MTVSELEREKDSQTEGHPFEVFVDRINRNARRHFRRTYVPGVSRADTDCRLPWKSILATAQRPFPRGIAARARATPSRPNGCASAAPPSI